MGSLLELTNLEQMERGERLTAEQLIQRAVDEIALPAAEQRVSISVEVAPYVLTGNEKLLHQAVFNLLENAVKYSPAGGTVQLSGQLTGRWFRIEVADQGPGIPKELRSRIFEPFFRVDDARSRQQGGAGLGLALVKAIAEAHGGTIRTEERTGGGSLFVMELPYGVESIPSRNLQHEGGGCAWPRGEKPRPG